MLFLDWLLQLLETTLSDRIAHFPLVRLLIHSLDKAILYYLIFLLIYGSILYLRKRQGRPALPRKRIVRDYLTFFYLVLLFHLTALRYDWQWWQTSWQMNRSLKEISLIPFIDTIKLAYGDSVFSFWYNFFGNVLWFIPFGILIPQFMKRRHCFFQTAAFGLVFSIAIETLQFFLGTGVTHIDDVIFNVMGTVLGYFIYDLFRIITKR